MARRFLSLYCPAVRAERLTELVEWCDRYTPLAAADGADGIILDITGCTHLFGGKAVDGETEMLRDMQRMLHRMGVLSQAAIADAWSVAWALARYGKPGSVLTENADSTLLLLPVEALRLPELVPELRRLGLGSIAAVRKIPRHSLTARFGPALLTRLDQMFGHAAEPLTPWRPPAPHRAMRILTDPVSTVSAVEYVLQDLLEEVCERLERNQLGVRHMDVACHRVDGTVGRCVLRTSKPTRSVPHLMRLFSGRLDKLKSGFGFEIFVLSVLDAENLDPLQLGFLQANPDDDESSFDVLIDRFGMRLGFQEVTRIRVRESFLPERAVEFRPATAATAVSADWPEYRIRPVQLLDRPVRISVSILIPGESPVQFSLGQTKHRIVRSEGPERLTPEWWAAPGQTRDYYRIEDERGFRFWIFRDPSEHWFLHGYLP